MDSERFGDLRQLLSSKPSERVWNALLELFEKWPKDDQREVALEYANMHLESWHSALRHFDEYKPDHSCWSLVRSLEDELLPLYEQKVVTNLAQLTILDFYECQKLQNIDLLAQLTKLTILALHECRDLQNLDGLANHANLSELYLDGCWSLEDIDGLTKTQNLTILQIETLHNDIDSHFFSILGCLERLEMLHLGFNSLQDMKVFTHKPNLTTLELYNCNDLKSMDGVENLQHLITLELKDCVFLEDLKGLSHLTKLETLVLKDCYRIENIDEIAHLPNLTTLRLNGCNGLEIAPEVRDMWTREEVSKYQRKIQEHSGTTNENELRSRDNLL